MVVLNKNVNLCILVKIATISPFFDISVVLHRFSKDDAVAMSWTHYVLLRWTRIVK